jgi:N-acetyl-gamma-glutamyl-phosphate reductase
MRCQKSVRSRSSPRGSSPAPAAIPPASCCRSFPLLKAGLLADSPLAVASMSGASGAGRKESIPLLFCEVQNSVRSYSVPLHRHLSEVGQELAIAAGREVKLSFVPHLMPTHSGICTTIFAQLKPGATIEQVGAALHAAYDKQPFVRLLGVNQSPDTKNVTGTNFVDVGWSYDARAGQLILMSTEDNIGKGASGQAVQNMNLICGFEATAGLMNI